MKATWSVIKRTLSSRKAIYSADGTFGLIGHPCNTSSDCVYNLCHDSVCEAPLKNCPTMSPPSVCSGHGQCSYFDISGINMSTCYVNDTSCFTGCQCEASYGGNDCSLDSETLLKRQKARVSLCRGLLAAVSGTDPSQEVITTLAASLLGSFDPSELTNSSDIEVCSEGLTALSQLIGSGFLKGSDSTLAINVAQTLSRFGDVRPTQGEYPDSASVPTESPTSNPTSSPTTFQNTSAYSKHTSLLLSSLQSLTSGITGNMVDGQVPTAVVTNNMKFAVHRNILSSLSGASLSPPSSDDELQYGVLQPGITLPENGLGESCSSSTGYAEMSIMKWGKNPYSNSSKVQSPLLRFSSSASGSNRRLFSSNNTSSSGDVYYVVMQFSRQNSLNSTTEIKIPQCQLRRGDEYISCGDCSLHNATDNNATFVCSNPDSLCNGGAGHGRSLQDSNGSSTASEYAAMLLAILKTIASVLSSNPFAMNLAQGKNVIMVVCGLFTAFIAGLVYFGRWDKHDVIKLQYVKKNVSHKGLEESNRTEDDELKISSQRSIDFEVHNSFFRAVIPTSNLLNNDSTIVLFLKKLLRGHDWLRLFSFPSTTFPRFLRYYALIISLMITLFIDTLFFQLQFPTGVCEIIPVEELCVMIKPVFPFGNPTQCAWTPSTTPDTTGSCALLPPPSTMLFSVMLTLVCLIFGLPLQLYLETVYLGILSKKPKYDMSKEVENEGENEEEVNFEVERLIRSSTKLIAGDLETSKTSWSSVETLSYYEKSLATAKVLGANEDGSPVPLTFMEWLRFGSRTRLLAWRIERARDRAKEVAEQVKQFEDSDAHHKDVVMMQHFVLEQFTPLRRLILQEELFDLHECKPQTIHYLKWTIAWFCCNGIYGFFLYWIFAWGIKVGPNMMSLWGQAFILSLIQDIFVISPVKLFVMHGLIIKDLRPQLKQIFHTLSNIAALKLNTTTPFDDDSQVVQYISPACRAARLFPDLPASLLLRAISDADYLLCRKQRKSRLGTFAIILISLPVLVSMLGESFGNFAIESLIPSIWGGFLMANDMILQISPLILVCLYIGVLIYFWVLYRVIKPRQLSVKSNSVYSNKKYKKSLSFSKKYSLYLISPEIRMFLKRLYKQLFLFENKFTDLTWKNMNKESFNQGRVLNSTEFRVKTRREVRPHGTMKTIPRQIWKVVHSGRGWKVHNGETYMNAKYSRDLAIDFSFDFIDKKINASIPITATDEMSESPLVFEILSFDITKRVTSSEFRGSLLTDDTKLTFTSDVHVDNIRGSGVEFEILSFDLKKRLSSMKRRLQYPSSVRSDLQSIPLGYHMSVEDDIKLQFEALSDADHCDEIFGKARKAFYASDLLLQWQLHPFMVQDEITFEVLAFDVSTVKIKESRRAMTEEYPQVKVKNTRSDMFVDESSGVLFEMISFDLSKKT